MKLVQCKKCLGTGVDSIGICSVCRGRGVLVECDGKKLEIDFKEKSSEFRK